MILWILTVQGGSLHCQSMKGVLQSYSSLTMCDKDLVYSGYSTEQLPMRSNVFLIHGARGCRRLITVTPSWYNFNSFAPTSSESHGIKGRRQLSITVNPWELCYGWEIGAGKILTDSPWQGDIHRLEFPWKKKKRQKNPQCSLALSPIGCLHCFWSIAGDTIDGRPR